MTIKNNSKLQNDSKSSGVIASIANNIIGKLSGVSKEIGLVKYKFGLSALKDRNIYVYINEDEVSMDVYINVDFGQSIPEISCALQEKIKNEVEQATNYRVNKVNVFVENFNFD